MQLESDPSSKELLASIFRTIHTIKGSCGFPDSARLEAVVHSGKNLDVVHTNIEKIEGTFRSLRW